MEDSTSRKPSTSKNLNKGKESSDSELSAIKVKIKLTDPLDQDLRPFNLRSQSASRKRTPYFQNSLILDKDMNESNDLNSDSDSGEEFSPFPNSGKGIPKPPTLKLSNQSNKGQRTLLQKSKCYKQSHNDSRKLSKQKKNSSKLKVPLLKSFSQPDLAQALEKSPSTDKVTHSQLLSPLPPVSDLNQKNKNSTISSNLTDTKLISEENNVSFPVIDKSYVNSNEPFHFPSKGFSTNLCNSQVTREENRTPFFTQEIRSKIEVEPLLNGLSDLQKGLIFGYLDEMEVNLQKLWKTDSSSDLSNAHQFSSIPLASNNSHNLISISVQTDKNLDLPPASLLFTDEAKSSSSSSFHNANSINLNSIPSIIEDLKITIENNSHTLYDELQDLKNSVTDIKLKLSSSVENSLSQSKTLTYAEAIKNKPKLPKSTIIVKPKNQDSSMNQITKEILKTSCPPNVVIRKFKNKYNHLEIRCSSEEGKTQLVKELTNSSRASELAIIEDKRPRLIKLILFNLPNSATEEQLKDIIKDNTDFSEDFDPSLIQLLKKLDSKIPQKEHWVVLIPKKIADEILQRGVIFNGFYKIYCKKYIPIRRCRKCQSFTHNENDCTQKRFFCEFCAGNHSSDKCVNLNKPFCINCHSEETINNKKLNPNHSASDSSCPVFLLHKSKTHC